MAVDDSGLYHWPTQSNQVVWKSADSNHPPASTDTPFHELRERHWTKVNSLSDVDNIYDNGFWHNLMDVVFI